MADISHEIRTMNDLFKSYCAHTQVSLRQISDKLSALMISASSRKLNDTTITHEIRAMHDLFKSFCAHEQVSLKHLEEKLKSIVANAPSIAGSSTTDTTDDISDRGLRLVAAINTKFEELTMHQQNTLEDIAEMLSSSLKSDAPQPLTVKEFAVKANVPIGTIYARVKTDLRSYVITGKTRYMQICSSGLSLFEKEEHLSA